MNCILKYLILSFLYAIFAYVPFLDLPGKGVKEGDITETLDYIN